jgi:outer membrane biosynthesis protein TonB
MKQPAGPVRARRSVPKKPVQLNLRRNAAPAEDELDDKPGNFWKWFALVFLAHVVVLIVLMLVFRNNSTPPPVQMISLLPPGDVAKGSPGAQAAPKLGATTPAPSHAHSMADTPPAPVTPPAPKPAKPKVHHVKPTPVKPPPIVKDNAPPITPTVKPTPPKPKIKVDLSQLVDAPDTIPPPKLKPKPHVKKTVRPPDDSPDRDQADSPTSGLSKDEVAQKLGAKLKAEGVDQGVTSGPSGAPDGKANDFADFYASLRDQVMNKWSIPNLSDATAVDPIVRIHVEKDGRVPPESVTLERSSNNQVYDESALTAARSIGYTLQPLPDHCPPDISITFKPNR